MNEEFDFESNYNNLLKILNEIIEIHVPFLYQMNSFDAIKSLSDNSMGHFSINYTLNEMQKVNINELKEKTRNLIKYVSGIYKEYKNGTNDCSVNYKLYLQKIINNIFSVVSSNVIYNTGSS